MVDFTSIQKSIFNQSPKNVSTKGLTGTPGPEAFKALLMNMRLQMLSAWTDSNAQPGGGTDFYPDSREILNILSRYQNAAAGAGDPSHVRMSALKQYVTEAVRAGGGNPLFHKSLKESPSYPAGTFLSSPPDAQALGGLPSPSREKGIFQTSSVKNAVSGKQDIRQLVLKAAGDHQIPQALFDKLIHTESAFNPDAVSPKGAMGLGQLMPATARELGLNFGDDQTEGSVWDPASNLDASARYLRKLYDMYRAEEIDADESWNFAAGAYNAGMGNIGKAMDRLDDGERVQWDKVAGVLPQVTGSASRETIRYVDRLRSFRVT